MNTDLNLNIAGRYKHFKGNDYTVFCVAKDENDNYFVLYRAEYGDNALWIRPYEMFFETVNENGKTLPRFKRIGKKTKQEDQLENLVSLLKREHLRFIHTETEEKYVITRISLVAKLACVHALYSEKNSGYLTEYEIARRLGYYIFSVDNKLEFSRSSEEENISKLEIGDNNINELLWQLNPCSIDLQIADSGFLKTKRRKVDPQSIEHISNAMDLWKVAKVYHSKGDSSNSYIKIRPNETILTHTLYKIHIPNDCAGKIEIKSTFARLSISITTGDFCNPDYNGFFPLEITNNGKHTVIIHAKETMAQLMLLPLQGIIIEKYMEKATYKNENGYDDGTPFSFWRERSLKTLRRKLGTQPLIDFYNLAQESTNASNTKDVNAFHERFENTFFTHCQKCIDSKTYKNINNNLPDVKKIIRSYIKKERKLNTIKSLKLLSGVFTIICAVSPVIIQLIIDGKISFNKTIWIPTLVLAIVFLIIFIILAIKVPKLFCTFEGVDIDSILSRISENN